MSSNTNYKIIMDVSGDIDTRMLEKYDLAFIPMNYSLGDEMRISNGPEDPEILKRFYAGQRKGDLTKTSQITPYMYEEYLKTYLDAGQDILYLCLSSGLSSTYQSACLAKENLMDDYPDRKFFPIDSLGATGGMGLLIERALKNREKGMSIEDNYHDILAALKKVKYTFVVQDLMYLMRGGRVSGATALIGTALNVKPILIINEQGKLDTIQKKRGNKAAVKFLLDLMAKDYDETTEDPVYIINADDQELSDQLEAGVRKMYPNVEIHKSVLCPIIGAHTGPGMGALVYMGK